MVWIRRVRTASGATAVQIVESVAGRRRIVRHVGSAHDEAGLGLLIAQANELIADDLQGVLGRGTAGGAGGADVAWSGVAAVAGSGAGPDGHADVLAAALRRRGWGLR